MLSQAIFTIMAQDETDITESEAVARLVNKYSGFTVSKLVEFQYLSLKTLVGAKDNSLPDDTHGNPNWAEKKIRHAMRYMNVFNPDVDRSDLPIVLITIDDEEPQNDQGDYMANVSIDIYVDPNVNKSNRCKMIAERIKKIFTKAPSSTSSSPKMFIDTVPGLSSFNLSYQDSSSPRWDHVKLRFKAYYTQYIMVD